MAIYRSPNTRIHRDFFYLNDEVAINSLSALESGRVDEIVSRTATAREGGFSGEVALSIASVGVDANKRGSSEIEEEIVRTRTRFSVFDAWYKLMSDERAIGTFDGWGDGALKGVEVGDTIEFRGELSLGPLQTVLRLYLWFAEQASKDGNVFSQKGEERKATVAGAKNVRQFLGSASEDNDDIPMVAKVLGEPGPLFFLLPQRSGLLDGWVS